MSKNETKTTHPEVAVADIQHSVTIIAKEDAELVAAAAVAFVNGLQVGSARAAANKQ